MKTIIIKQRGMIDDENLLLLKKDILIGSTSNRRGLFLKI
jgi:hypothetical protein